MRIGLVCWVLLAAGCPKGEGTCPEGQVCEPVGDGVDGHGCRVLACDEADALPCSLVSACVAGACERLACTLDADCPCGTCIQGGCWERPWICFVGAE